MLADEPQEQFKGVELATEYPMQSVAEHEVLLVFRHDSDAYDFREWWSLRGSALFNTWLKSR